MPRLLRVDAPDALKGYKAVLREFMAFYHQRANPYPKDREFTDDELAPIRPDDIYKWMCKKVYHKEEPGPEDRPIFGRSDSLKFYKKAISYFMPNRLMTWNELTNTGNPTKSILTNTLIRVVIKKETRGLGKPSQADREFEKEEFEQQIAILQTFDDIKRKYMYPTMFKFQFHLIARIDDTAHVRKDSIQVCPQFPEIALVTRLRWSKNVREERDAPTQIILGAMNPIYCMLLAFSIFLEVYIGTGEGQIGEYVFCEAGCDPDTVKDHASSAQKKYVLKNPHDEVR